MVLIRPPQQAPGAGPEPEFHLEVALGTSERTAAMEDGLVSSIWVGTGTGLAHWSPAGRSHQLWARREAWAGDGRSSRCSGVMEPLEKAKMANKRFLNPASAQETRCEQVTLGQCLPVGGQPLMA